MTEDGRRFSRGSLPHCRSSSVWRPSVASYLRMVPSQWAGVFHCWGVENREAPLRFVPGTIGSRDWVGQRRNQSRRSERKSLPCGRLVARAGSRASAAVACCLIRSSVDPVGSDIPRLPTSLADAIERLEGSDVLRRAMGDPLFEAFPGRTPCGARNAWRSQSEEIVAATAGGTDICRR